MIERQLRMRLRPLTIIAALFLGMLLPSCSGGGGGGSRTSVSACSGSATFCVIGCNLSCGTSGSCGVTEIAQNQTIELQLSNEIDPSTVNAASVSLRTAAGEVPAGRILVSGRRLTFIPEVIVNGASTSFGFKEGETYTLTLPGGSQDPLALKSVNGDSLGSTLRCNLTVSQGLVDADGLPPVPKLVNPDSERDVPMDSAIKVEFSELIDVAPFLLGDTATSPIKYEMRLTKLPDPPVPGALPVCDPDFAPVRILGTPRVSTEIRLVDQGQGPLERQVTVVTLVPETPLPELVCVQVRVTNGVRDLLGTPAAEQTFEFYTQGTPIGRRAINETFQDDSQLDPLASSGSWSAGLAIPGRLGGSGVHGSFDHRVGKRLGNDTYLFSTESQLIPGENALFGDDVMINDGVFQFTDFVVPEGVSVIFRGPKPAIIYVQGSVEVLGTFSVSGEASDPNFNARSLPDGLGGFGVANPGESGGVGGAFGGSGGDGGESCHGLGGIVIGPDRNTPFDGQRGEGLNVPGTSGYGAVGGNAGGQGSMVFPVTGDAFALSSAFARFGAFHPNASSQLNGGGGGGAFFTVGGAGAATVTHQPDGGPGDLGDGGGGGSAISFTPLPVNTSVFDHFLLGGSGGGGGGSHAVNMEPLAFQQKGTLTDKGPALGQPWHAGGGGGGGGGALGLAIGRDLIIGPDGSLESRGGGGVVYGTGAQIQENGPPGPGGGGSGGSVVLQVGRFVQNDGAIDVRGGAGAKIDGLWFAGSLAGFGFFWPLQSSGGDGASGYVRMEGESAAALTPGTVLGPPSLTSDNLADLQESNDQTGFRSKWYDTGFDFPPKWDHYEVLARIGGQEFSFTDQSEGFNPATRENSPALQFLIQGAILDPQTGDVDGSPGPWRSFANSDDGKGSLNLDRSRAFRFMFLFDRAVESDLEILDVKVFYSR